jgi:uncharacterized delta-60 repeat protein
MHSLIHPQSALVERLEDRRLLSAGELDPAFSGDGQLIDAIGSDAANMNVAVAVGSDGKTLVAVADNHTLTVTRYLSDGALDTAFGRDGRSTVAIQEIDRVAPILSTLAPDIALDGSGNVVVTAGAELVRLTRAGTLDPGFGGGDGAIDFDFDLYALLVEPDGKLLVGGASAVQRIFPSGTLDPSFAEQGTLTLADPPDSPFTVTDLDLQTDGKLIVTGYPGFYYDEVQVDVSRYNADGALDVTFGDGGHFRGRDNAFATDTVIDGNGNILVLANFAGSDWSCWVERLTPQGTQDFDFGDNGRAYVHFNDDLADLGDSILIDNRGRILVGGRLSVQRLNSDGSEDQTFSYDSRAQMNLAHVPDDPRPQSGNIALAPDGKIVVAGAVAFDDHSTKVGVARFEVRKPTKPWINLSGSGVLRMRGNDASEGWYVSAIGDGRFIEFARSDDAHPSDVYLFSPDQARKIQAVQLDARGGDDYIWYEENWPVTLKGGDGNDTMRGGSGPDDLLDGGKGDDQINGHGTLVGGFGNDSFESLFLSDTIFGGKGQDSVVGDTSDVLHDVESSTLRNVEPVAL